MTREEIERLMVEYLAGGGTIKKIAMPKNVSWRLTGKFPTQIRSMTNREEDKVIGRINRKQTKK